MNNQSVEQLEAQLAALGPKTQPTTAAQPEPHQQIADNDPELGLYGFVNGKRVEETELDRLYNKLNPMSLEDAKRGLVARRKRAKQTATVRNDSLPMAQRIAAATEIRNEGSFPHLKPEQVIEKLCA